jgi:hypothetical protein
MLFSGMWSLPQVVGTGSHPYTTCSTASHASLVHIHLAGELHFGQRREVRFRARWQYGKRASVVFGTAAIAAGFASVAQHFKRMQQQLCRVAVLQPSLGQFCLFGRGVQYPYDGALSCPREVLGKPGVVSSWHLGQLGLHLSV